MAYLRRGLVTSKGAVPSIHTRQQALQKLSVVSTNGNVAHINIAENDDDAQPVISIRKVAKILRMANTNGDYHLVQLECGHTVKSKSTFQGYCNQCKVSHA